MNTKPGNLFKKMHRWPGLVLAFILGYYAVTGIIMNHRELVSGTDISRNALPEQYSYRNWNNGAIKGSLQIGQDSILIYGNIGIWLTDSSFQHFAPWNSGFPEGSDNRKIFDVHQDPNRELYAATLFGLYAWNQADKSWKRFGISGGHERFVGIESIADTLYALSRSHLYKGRAEGVQTRFSILELPATDGYENKISLFATIWQTHSGEVFGLPGKIFVDILGLITLFLCITGTIYFFFPGWIRRRNRKSGSPGMLPAINRWSLKWHNKIGAWTFVLLIILYFTGMLLRPPLIIAIARAELSPLKYTHLDQPNPWHDKLRDILYDPNENTLLLSTSEGMYDTKPYPLSPRQMPHQPPVSVMGITTFQPLEDGSYLIGSFSGLFRWHPDSLEVRDYFSGKIYREPAGGRPVGEYKITGAITHPGGGMYVADYEQGILPSPEAVSTMPFPQMPSEVLNESGMSLWNVCLEIHSGRFFRSLTGDGYILLVPLSRLLGITVLISGYLLWRKKYRHKP